MIGRRISAALAGVVLVVGLAGCAGRGPLDSSAASAMQDSVVAVAQLASHGDPNGANAQLDQLQTQLDSAIAGDLVTAARAARIQTAIDAVRADLATLIAAPADPSSTQVTGDQPSDTTVTDGGSTNSNSGPGNSNGDPNGNSGKGKGKGKGGKGNG